MIYAQYHRPEVFHYDNNTTYSHRTGDGHFGMNRKLKRNLYIMFWMDLVTIIIHNIIWLWFFMELLLQYDQSSGIAGLVFSILEFVITIGNYFNLWFNPKIEYYSQQMVILHTFMECLVNLPMITILFIYWFGTGDKLLPSLYFALIVYSLYGVCKYIVFGMIWAQIKDINTERNWGLYICFHNGIWIILSLCFFVLESVFANLGVNIGSVLKCYHHYIHVCDLDLRIK